MTTRYTFENSWELAEARLRGLQNMWDAASFRILRQVSVPAGARCLEVGAGSGSVTRWLAQEVGPDGLVCSVDIDATFLRELNLPNVEVHEIDITKDDLPAAGFDVVYARLVLEHIPDAVGTVLGRLRDALRPGGTLIVADLDTPGPDNIHPRSDVYRAVSTTFLDIAADNGWDVNFGRRLPSLLAAAGLGDVAADGTQRILNGGHEALAMMRLSFEQVRGALKARGHSDEEVDVSIACLDDPRTTWMSAILVHAWGKLLAG